MYSTILLLNKVSDTFEIFPRRIEHSIKFQDSNFKRGCITGVPLRLADSCQEGKFLYTSQYHSST
jgi:hypothetical protein